MREEMYDLLIRSLDEPLTEAETQQLEQALSESDELRKAKEELLRMRSILGHSTYQFNPFFVGRVMHRLPKAQEPLTVPWGKAFQQIALPGLALLIFLCVFVWVQEGSLSWEVLTGIQTV